MPRREMLCKRNLISMRTLAKNSSSAGIFSKCQRAPGRSPSISCAPTLDELSTRLHVPLSENNAAPSDLQVVIGDGLSVSAISAQVPGLLPLLFKGGRRSWSAGRPFVIRHCRVGVMNEIGELLDPEP